MCMSLTFPMGLANKIAYKFATTMFTTFEQSKGLAKTKHVGAITKVGMATSNQSDALEKIKEQFDDNLKTVLFIGGSAGAKYLMILLVILHN